MQSKLKTIQGTWNDAPDAVTTIDCASSPVGPVAEEAPEFDWRDAARFLHGRLFATNFSVAGLRIAYDALVAAMSRILGDFSAADRDRFFWQNAKAFYRL